jgi:protein-S-isoprenylcysteine O-methyltransferase Ste14
LLQTGPYARMRHPMYLAEMLLWLGLTIYFGSLLVLGTASIGVILAARFVIPREERALESQFGEEYRRYRERVPALIGWKRRSSREGDRGP